MLGGWARCALFAGAFSLLVSAALAQQKTTLRFWDVQQNASGLSGPQQEAIRRFEAENPTIDVEVTTFPYSSYRQRLLSAAQGDDGPDVATVDQIWLPAFAEAGAIAELGELAAESAIGPEDFFAGAWESVVYDGKLWGIPFNVDVWFFAFVNRKLFHEAGIDPATIATWAGLRAAAEQLTDPQKGQFAIGLTGNRSEYPVVMTNSFVYSNGGSVLDEDGKCALTSPEAIEALSFYRDMAEYTPPGILTASNGHMRELFLNGVLAIELWPALEGPILENRNIDWDLLAGFAPEGKTPVGVFGGWNLVISSKSPRKEAAWKFIEFLTRQDVNGDVVDLIPANSGAAKARLEEGRRRPDVILQHLSGARARPLSPNYLDISEIQQEMIQAFLSGTSVEEAASAACTRIDALRP